MEFFDVCDARGIPTGEVVERSVAHREGVRHRTVHIWVIRTVQGRTQVLLQKRSRDKDSFPGLYDTSAAGHILAGCEPLPSALRELGEELGVAASADELDFAGNFTNDYETEFYGKPFRDRDVAFVYVYKGAVEAEDLRLQAEEIERVDWFDLHQLERAVQRADGRFCVPAEGLKVLRGYLEGGRPACAPDGLDVGRS